MSTKVTNNTGSGKIKDDSLISFSYAEETTPLDPMSSSGGTSQVSITAIEETSNWNGSTHDNSKLMINNSLTVTDSTYGSVQVDVKKVSTGSSGAVTVIGDSLLAKLNVNKTAEPFNGNLANAIIYYCSLCGITPTFGSSLSQFEAINVTYIGWTGNVWNYLKMLCAVTSLSTTARVPFEAYFTGTTLGFRPVGSTVFDMESTISDYSQTIDSFDAALTVSLYNYNTSYVTDQIIYSQSDYADTIDPNQAFLTSVAGIGQVNAGQTIKKKFTMDTSLVSIKQPVCASTIGPFPYQPSYSTNISGASYAPTDTFGLGYVTLVVSSTAGMVAADLVTLSTSSFTGGLAVLNNGTFSIDSIISSTTLYIKLSLGTAPISFQSATGSANINRSGQYVIVGKDNLPVLPSQWNDLGGSITVARTENLNEIEITITAPADDKIQAANDPDKYSYAPYSIGIETSGDGFEYPALYLIGTGVKFNKKEVSFLTGSDSGATSKDLARTIDNPFITNVFTLTNAGLSAAQSACSPSISMNGQSAPIGFSFGNTIGNTFVKNNIKMRLSSLSYSVENISWDAERYTTFSDFDTKNTGKTFGNFDTVTGGSTPISFAEFSVVPLIES